MTFHPLGLITLPGGAMAAGHGRDSGLRIGKRDHVIPTRTVLMVLTLLVPNLGLAAPARGQCSPSGLDDTRNDSTTSITFRAHFTDNDTSDPDYFIGSQATASVNAAADAYDAFSSYLFSDPYQNDLDSTGIFHTYIYNIGGVAAAYANCFTMDAPSYVGSTVNCVADVTSHELFHTVQRRYMCSVPVDCTDDNVSVGATFGKWVSEGQAQMMMDHVTLTLDGIPAGGCPHRGFLRVVQAGSSAVGSPILVPNTSLVDLGYAACLFWKYCCEQHSSVTAEPFAGMDFIEKFWDHVDATGTNNSLAHLQSAIVDPGSGGESISDTWQDYAICNYTKDYDVSTLPDFDRWFYVDENQYGEGGYGSVPTTTLVTGSTIIKPAQNAYSIQYYQKDFTPGTCDAVGVYGEAGSAAVGWALVGIDTNANQAIVLSRQQGREYGRVLLASPATNIDRIGVIVATLSNSTSHDVLFDTGDLTLTINSPTASSMPAYPGIASDPGRFLVRTLVEGPDGLTPDGPDSLSVLGLEASDFVVEVGGLPATVHSAGYVGGEYWLVAQAPVQTSDGTYDLAVSLCNGSVSDVVVDGVEYGDILINHVVVIDNSQSMDDPPTGTSKLEAAKNAATMYIDSVPDDDWIGVVFFSGNGTECDDDATLLLPLTAATSFARGFADVFIEALTSDYMTSIGDGLWMAQDQIDASTSADIDAIILLSDGNENEGRFWYTPNPLCSGSEGPVRDRFLTTSTLINTLSFGRQADQSLMQDIATDTGGVHDYIPVEGSGFRGTTGLSMENRLAEAYIDALASARDLQQVFSGSGNVSAPFTEVTIPITESGLADVVFIFNIDNEMAMLNVRLFDPTGHEIADPADAAIYSNADQTHTVVHLLGSPMTGDWVARLEVVEDAEYLAAVLGANRHGAQLEFAFSQIRNGGVDGVPERSLYEQGVPIRFVAMLTDQFGPILDATITARVELPDGQIACGNYRLSDDGKNSDGEANNGVYCLVFTQTYQGSREGVDNDGDQPWDPDSGDPGTYMVRIQATGVTNSGDPFERIITTGFHIFASLEDADFDGIPDTWEIYYDTDPNTSNASADFDHDGLSNEEEFENGTHPFSPDTDADGENDQSEVDGGRCPLDPEDGALDYPLDVHIVTDHPDDDEKTPIDPETLLLRFPWAPEYEKLRMFRAADLPVGFVLHDVIMPPDGPKGTYVDSGLNTGRRYFYLFEAEAAAGARSRFSRIISGVPQCRTDVNADCDANGVGDACELDGAGGEAYGNAVSVQDTQTQFGDSDLGLIGLANGSELDAGYATIRDGMLYLLLAGNLESNFNKLEIFIDSIDGEGQNRLRGDNPDVDSDGLNRMGDDGSGNGLTFDAGFAPDYWLSLTGGDTPYKLFGSYAELLTAGGGIGRFLGSTSAGGSAGGLLSGGDNPDGIRATIDNTNTNGVSAGIGLDSGEGVTTGLELVVPLTAIGSPAGAIRICAFVNGVGHDYVSNQVLGPIGGGSNLGEPRLVDFNPISGDQFFTVDPDPDCDTNGLVDTCEFAHGVAEDCNGNGVVDGCDLIGGGDFDADGNVDLTDHQALVECMGGPEQAPTPSDPQCAAACLAAFDFDDDGDVDLRDFGGFQEAFTG